MSDTGYALSASGAISRVLMKHIATRIVGLCSFLNDVPQFISADIEPVEVVWAELAAYAALLNWRSSDFCLPELPCSDDDDVGPLFRVGDEWVSAPVAVLATIGHFCTSAPTYAKDLASPLGGMHESPMGTYDTILRASSNRRIEYVKYVLTRKPYIPETSHGS